MASAVTEFLTPKHINVEQISATHARVTLEPLERGFGHTLGNALRRILLSSMPGFAISEVEIVDWAPNGILFTGLEGISTRRRIDLLARPANLKRRSVMMVCEALQETLAKETGTASVERIRIRVGVHFGRVLFRAWLVHRVRPHQPAPQSRRADGGIVHDGEEGRHEHPHHVQEDHPVRLGMRSDIQLHHYQMCVA